jgi:hypothetical protein
MLHNVIYGANSGVGEIGLLTPARVSVRTLTLSP